MSSTWNASRVGLLAGALFASIEASVSLVLPAPLDPQPTALVVAASIVATACLIGLISAALGKVIGRSAVGVALALWAAVWGPHQAKLAGWHRVGWAPTIVIAGTAVISPGIATVIGVLGGGVGAVVRSQGRQRGLTPVARAAGDRLKQPDILLVTLDGAGDPGILDHGRWHRGSTFSPTEGWTHFSGAVSPAPWVLPSMHSLLSGDAVRDHGGGLVLGKAMSRRVPDSVPLPYILQQAGYETQAFISNPYLSVEQGFADGFERWFHSSAVAEPIMLLDAWGRFKSMAMGRRRAVDIERNERLVSAAISAVQRSSKRPRFVWVHLASGPATDTASGALEASRADKDEVTRALVERLSEASRQWIVAIVGTHAGATSAHGAVGKDELSDESLRVPLAIRRPRTQGGVVARPVAAADLARTLLAAAADARHFPGQNLMKPRRVPIEVGGARGGGEVFAARMPSGHYVAREAGVVGPAVSIGDDTEELLRSNGYLD